MYTKKLFLNLRKYENDQKPSYFFHCKSLKNATHWLINYTFPFGYSHKKSSSVKSSDETGHAVGFPRPSFKNVDFM
jgi:hypothetical protein